MCKTKRKISAFLSDKGNVALWGCGGLGKASLRDFIDKDRLDVVIDKTKHGEVFAGQVVLSPDAVDRSKIDTVIITSAAHHQIREELKQGGFEGKVYYIYELVSEVYAGSTNDFQLLWLDILAVKNANIFRLFLDKPQLFVNVTFRAGNFCAKYWYLKPLYWIIYLLHAITCLLTSVQLPLGTSIGGGFAIAHYGTIVFSKRAKIGNFFTIYHGCTVGTNYSGKAPVIGDYVTQYAGSHILGDTHIADYCTIGANSVVLDLTSEVGDTIVGSPAKIKRKSKK
jgi:serine acetyltransferase